MPADTSPTDPTVAAGEVPRSEAGSVDVTPTVLAGRYEIQGLLGTGGMGRVYRAYDRELREAVALKVLHRDWVQSAEMVERFRQEVRLARRVTHRNVARTFDIGEHDGEKLLTMELVVGESLSARLERGMLPVPEAIALAREIVAGMAAAHAVGVVHRDLKPDNVLLETTGRVVITDFGIARAPDAGDAGRTGGRIVGTPAYMAPEQLGGATDLDARADIYAFGAILFELLTGRRAWPGAAALAVAAARLVEPPPDPRALRADLSPSLAEAVLRCLARDRNDRWKTAAELDQALAAADASSAATMMAPAPSPAKTRDRTVAIVPLRNLGPPDEAYFAEGLTEDLVDVLATVRGLRVRGRAYPDPTDRDVVDTGRRLGVDVVVEGSVRRLGPSVRVSARVVGVEDGFQIWSSRFERPVADAFGLNDEVARAIAGVLSATLAAGDRPRPSDGAAIDLYFRARYAVGRFWTTEGVVEAQALFREALARAPDDPTILAGFVHAQIGRNFFASLDANETIALVRRALSVGGRLPETWVALAAVRFNHRDDPPGAARAVRRALELGPSSSDAHDLAGRLLLEADLIPEAVAHLDRALWLDPAQRWARVDRMRAAALVGDWAKVRALTEDGPGAHWAGHKTMHDTRLGTWPGAPPAADGPIPEETDARFRTLITAYRRARASSALPPAERPQAADIRAAMEAIVAKAPPQSRARRFFLQMTAEQQLLCGWTDAALDAVEASVGAGLLDLGWMNRLGLLDPLRATPRFEALRREVAARAETVHRAWQGPVETLEEALASLGG